MRILRHFAPTLVLALVLIPSNVLLAHDMFWRLTSYFVAPGTALRLPVLNGTFSKSENSIAWARVADLSVVAPAGRATIDSAHWATKSDTSALAYTAGASGTYVVGLSTKTKDFDVKADAFNQYLNEDGIPDILALRKKNGSSKKDARERYGKHVKAIFQVGDTRTDAWAKPLGYAAELMPMANPYALKASATLDFKCLVDGAPVANQLGLVGGRAGTSGDARLATQTLRSDANGVVHVSLRKPGRWYVKFIHMVPLTNDTVDYESKWATISFEVR
jgi:hypothetical protein